MLGYGQDYTDVGEAAYELRYKRRRIAALVLRRALSEAIRVTLIEAFPTSLPVKA